MKLIANPHPLRNLTPLALAAALAAGCADSPSEPAGRDPFAPSFTQMQGTPVLNSANGHYYQAVRVAGKIDYASAKAAAAALSHMGVQGHLVTITSSAENDFIVNTFPEAVNPDPTSSGWSKHEGYWIGAERVDANTWQWITGEPFSYSSWSGGEPNNSGGVENRINFWPTWPGPVLGKWNDRDGTAAVHGYVVEFTPPAGGGVIVIDDFTSGTASWNLHGGGAPHYLLQTGLSDVLGGVREHGHYNNNGGRLDAVAGTLEWGVRESRSPEYSVSYGSTVGLHRVHSSVPTPNAAAAVPLNLNVMSAQSELVIDVVNVVSANYVVIHLRTGSGEHFQATATLSVGEVRVPFSSFQSWWNGQYFDDTDAADIDGIHFWQNGSIPVNGQGTKFGRFSIALASSQPTDNTPPAITPTVEGTQGAKGWYVSDVSVSWTVTDGEGAVTSQSGCDAVTVSADTQGQTLTCTATSAGGTASESVTIKRDAGLPTISGSASTTAWTNADVQVTYSCSDATSGIESCAAARTVSTEGANQSVSGFAHDNAGNTASVNIGSINIDTTAPAVSYSGNAGSYTVDQAIQISCSATDALSGIATSSCPGASDNAYAFRLGSNALSASATDNAGNSATASTTFSVQVTPGSLCVLVQRWVSQRGVQNSLCQQLANGAITAFRNHVQSQSGKFIPADKAAILLRLSDVL